MVSRRTFMRLGAAGVGTGLAFAYTDGDDGLTVPFGGSGAEFIASDVATTGDGSGGSSRVLYQVDVATGLSAVESGETPQLIYITQGDDRGEYVNVDDDDVPVHLKTDGFELWVVDSLSEANGRSEPISLIYVRQGDDRGVHVDVGDTPAVASDDTIGVSVAAALADAIAPAEKPSIYGITDGDDRGVHVAQ